MAAESTPETTLKGADCRRQRPEQPLPLFLRRCPHPRYPEPVLSWTGAAAAAAAC